MQPIRLHPLLIVPLLLCILLGCSGSDEMKQEQKEQDVGEMKTADVDTTVVPSTETPPDISPAESELPTSEKELPRQKDTGSQREIPAETPPSQTAGNAGMMMWSVQIGAFKNEIGATQSANDARSKFNQPIYKQYDPVTGFHKVTVGSFATYDQASQFKIEVQAKGYPDAFPVEVKR